MKTAVFAFVLALPLLLWGLATPVRAEASTVGETLARQIDELAQAASRTVSAAMPDARVEIEVGQLDARLRLAPCEKVHPYLPPNTRLWGRTRIGLRCEVGERPWNVYLPVTVKVFAMSMVAAGTLPVGTVVSANDLRAAEVDLAADSGAALRSPEVALGRTLARPLAAGQALRSSHLRARQWFAAGDTVRILAVGNGYSVSGEGRALSPGLEGQPVRVRTDSGRVVSGMAVAERQVEVAL